MRYYFDVRIGTNEVLDEQGSDGLDVATVRRLAIASLPVIVAENLPVEDDHYVAEVKVRDETNRPVFAATLTVESGWLTPPHPNGQH
ncbi:hypothetical protein SAMN06297251_11535 [Fulvimarina manganoxydans]|uniref:DUF6894 domain-containing protein n=1 Tax=Fulvimarina manganoxydans TaxID=937218 RepID=A0A1W2DH95_9HYPH|nr:hypothetical protein [Fulvimarina manganoxydans]MCK5932413.1 hypothetical protein [Fulvimarina manganoxydans]MEE2949740.1 hypothetical protein [Pseudomonadota bacterium]SMC96805.1 hypothetical protein SAMN06297251_11535 [Fulvimarina manganoxydans]